MSQSVAHEVLSYEHDPGADSYGMEAVEALGLSAETVFKTLVVSYEENQRSLLAVAVIPVVSKLDLKAMARSLGAKRAAMAEPAAAERSSGYLVGGISPLGQKKLLATVVDDSALALETMHVSAGRRGLEVALRPRDLIELLDATLSSVTT